MEAIPEVWMDKLFACMAEWYGERWLGGLTRGPKFDLERTIWRSALYGLGYHEIKGALMLCRRHAQQLGAIPPHPVEFYHYAKGVTQPYIDFHPKANIKTNPAIVKQYLSEIRQKLGKECSTWNVENHDYNLST